MAPARRACNARATSSPPFLLPEAALMSAAHLACRIDLDRWAAIAVDDRVETAEEGLRASDGARVVGAQAADEPRLVIGRQVGAASVVDFDVGVDGLVQVLPVVRRLGHATAGPLRLPRGRGWVQEVAPAEAPWPLASLYGHLRRGRPTWIGA